MSMSPSTIGTRSPATPGTWVQVAAILVACTGYLLLAAGGVAELRPFPPAVIALLPVAAIAAALPRQRWPKLGGAFVAAVALFGALVVYRATYDRLADPGHLVLWVGTALQVSGLVVAVAAGAIAARRVGRTGRQSDAV